MANALIEVKNSDQFNKLLSLSDCLIVVHFMADWAQQCSQINDVLIELSKSKDYANVKFAKIETESVPEISKQFDITSVPTCILLSNKKEIERIEGADVHKLVNKVKQNSFKFGSLITSSPNIESNNIEDKLKALINRSPIMVFMKGSPSAPRCGFSRTLVSILNELNIKYDTFDIFSDENVRQELKTYSNWPTYPQIYANGNLIGGLDIIKELKESGELEEALKV